LICAAPEPQLSEYFADAYRPLQLVGAPLTTLRGYQTALAQWSRWPGHPTMPRTDSRAMARFAEWLLPDRSAATVNSYCKHILAILRFAADEDDIAAAPKFRKLKEMKRVPLALTNEEFLRVLATAEQRRGTICGIPSPLWWGSLLCADYESGVRVTAMLSVASCDVLLDQGGFFCQAEPQKDREAAWYPLSPDTIQRIRRIYDPNRKLLWPLDVTPNALWRRFRTILNQSGIYAPKGCGLCFHRVRKSKASYTEAAGGDAQRALGHSARSVTERYLDPRIVGRAYQPPMPLPRPR
jgi:integrase